MRSAESFHSIWNRSSRFIGGFNGGFRRFLGVCGWGVSGNSYRHPSSTV